MKYKFLWLFVALAIVLGIGWYLLLQSPNNAKTTIQGKLISKDLSAMSVDGPGIFKIQTNQATETVEVDAGESACDREAIKLPNKDEGDEVQVSAMRVNGTLQVCETGTYIR